MKSQETQYMAIGVDMQNDFCPGGALAVPDGDKVIAPFNVLSYQVRKAGGKVIYTRDWHPTRTNHFEIWPPHCIADTEGSAFHPNLNVMPEDYILSKGTLVDEDAYSGFQGLSENGDTLEEIIKAELNNAQNLILAIGGLATDYCVKATVLDALRLKEMIDGNRLTVVALRGCMRAVNIKPSDEEDALRAMKDAGAVFELPSGTVL